MSHSDFRSHSRSQSLPHVQPYASPRTSLQILAEKLPFLHPQPTPRSSRDWSRDNSRRTSIGLPTPGSARKEYSGNGVGDGRGSRSKYGLGIVRVIRKRKGHRRQLSLSSFSLRGFVFFVGVIVVGILVVVAGFWTVRGGSELGVGWWSGGALRDDGGVIPLGQSRMRGGREVFWWEGFDRLNGYYRGCKEVVKEDERVSEQEARLRNQKLAINETYAVKKRDTKRLVLVDVNADKGFVPCYIDEEREILPPKLFAFNGLPQGFSEPLFGSHQEIGLRGDVCYDRINRFGSYGFGFAEEEGGLGIKMEGDTEGRDAVQSIDYRNVKWGRAQEQCTASKQYSGPRTAFIIRTWHDFEYTPYHIMMFRAIISELALTSGGKYTIHFLIHVHDDSIPIWASDKIYDQILKASLPREFAGMGTLWSVAQMKLIYPPPFPDSLANFSGDDIYKAYRSLHFALQYFAMKHPEFKFFWHWEMDIRVTGGYLELLEQVTRWAEKQERELLWEKSAKFFIPSLYNWSYEIYQKSVRDEVVASGKQPILGPQIPELERLSIAGVTDRSLDDSNVDLITFSPLFNPNQTRWAFHDDMTGYPPSSRPPTRAALVTASRLSRRLLMTMHHETFERNHTMFPEMFPASIALQYGYKAVYAPLPIYFDRDWPAAHANEVFNNAALGEEGKRAGMDHGGGHFHGKGGSIFGPGEHVFRGASWYSNAGFAGYLWRRWLGKENGNGEIDWESNEERGRMCLPMMVVHPVKFE